MNTAKLALIALTVAVPITSAMAQMPDQGIPLGMSAPIGTSAPASPAPVMAKPELNTELSNDHSVRQSGLEGSPPSPNQATTPIAPVAPQPLEPIVGVLRYST